MSQIIILQCKIILFFGLFQWTIKHLGLDAVMNYGCEFEVKNKKKIESLFAV